MTISRRILILAAFAAAFAVQSGRAHKLLTR